MTLIKHADNFLELFNTIAFGYDTLLKSIAFGLRFANRSLTQTMAGQNFEQEDGLRIFTASIASSKKILYANFCNCFYCCCYLTRS